MSNLAFYTTRAAQARQDAAAATLAMVRDRCLRAAAVWEEMAARAARIDYHRAEEASYRALRDDAAALAAAAGHQDNSEERSALVLAAPKRFP
jgi:hypothetical protein